MPSQTATAKNQPKMPRSDLIRRYLACDLAAICRGGKPLSVVDEAQILGYFEQILIQLEMIENDDVKTETND